MTGMRVLAAVAMAAGLGVAAPAPASAASAECRVNVLCLYDAGRSSMSQYSEYTDYYQQLSRRDVALAWNRTPTTVYFNYSTGVTSCILGGRFADLRVAGYGDVTGIRLTNSNTCY